jgi:hypothetical protein
MQSHCSHLKNNRFHIESIHLTLVAADHDRCAPKDLRRLLDGAAFLAHEAARLCFGMAFLRSSLLATIDLVDLTIGTTRGCRPPSVPLWPHPGEHRNLLFLCLCLDMNYVARAIQVRLYFYPLQIRFPIIFLILDQFIVFLGFFGRPCRITCRWRVIKCR